MASQMERWYQAAFTRRSIRTYSSAPDASQIEALEALSSSISMRGLRVKTLRSDRVFAGLLGSKIKGTDTFAALISSAARPETAGYIGEAYALECEALGLGACWLGASFSKSGAKGCVELSDGERLICILSVGVPAESPSQRPRRTLGELTELTCDEYEALPIWKRRALECARLAPSAINAQPWSFDPTGDGIVIENISRNFGWGRLDCGIAMLHVELGAAHCGVRGEWREGDTINQFLPV